MQLSHLEQVYGNDYDHVCQNWHEQGVIYGFLSNTSSMMLRRRTMGGPCTAFDFLNIKDETLANDEQICYDERFLNTYTWDATKSDGSTVMIYRYTDTTQMGCEETYRRVMIYGSKEDYMKHYNRNDEFKNSDY
jgi:hypothetical protein